MNKIVEIEKKVNRDDLIYKTGNEKNDKTYDFRNFKTIRSFGRKIYNNYLLLDDALEKQIRLKDDIDTFKESTKQKESVKKEKRHQLLKMQLYFWMEDKKFLILLNLEYFQKKSSENSWQVFKIA